MKRVYKLLVEGRGELPFFQVIAISVTDLDVLNPEVLESRVGSWMNARGEYLVSIDPEETAEIDAVHVPKDIRDGTAEIAPVSGRIFHPDDEVGLWKRFVRWLS